MRSVIRWYRLNGKKPVRVETARGHIAEMARRHETMERSGIDPWCVAKTEIGAVTVSTVFLGLDHNHFGKGPPLLF
jgi:hypothetical protein